MNAQEKRQVEEAINTIQGKLLQIQLVLQGLKELLPPPPETVNYEVLRIVADTLGMQPADYREKVRHTEYVELRRMGVMCLRAINPTITLNELAECIGYGDHSTIIHMLQTGQGYLDIGQQPFTDRFTKVLNAVNEWHSKQIS